MRAQELDERETAAFRALQFTIDDDNEVATIVGQITVAAFRPHRDDRIWLTIILPDGQELNCLVSRRMFLDVLDE
jgi:hypothetical protein